MIPNLNEIKPQILKFLKLEEDKVFMEFDKEYPECLCMVVAADIGPGPMDKVMKLLQKEGEGELRLCANIVEEELAYRVIGLDFDQAWEESWNIGCATVRMG
jgi:hypothetical protein